MSKQYQNMDPNSTTSFDDDHTKFRARFERLGTFSLGYDPSLLQASPESSSTVSRSPLKPVKIRTDWSRPDLDDDPESDLNSSGICQFSLDNLEDSVTTHSTSQECNFPSANCIELSSILAESHHNPAPSSPLMAAANTVATEACFKCDIVAGLSGIFDTASDNESDMDLSSICDVIISDRIESESVLPSINDESRAFGEIAPSDPESDHDCQSEPAELLDENVSDSVCRESVSSDSHTSADILLPACEPSPIHDSRQNNSRNCSISEGFKESPKLSESELENFADFTNMSPKRNPLSKSAEGTPARALFPVRARSVEGTPLQSSTFVSRDASVSSSFNVEGTPKRNRAIDQVQSEVPELVVRLNSKHDDWTRRYEALKRISKFTTFHISAASLSEALFPLVDPLMLQLQDLRSQVVKQACITVGDLAVCLGFQFQAFARRLVPRLLDLLRIAKKVMSSSGDDCLRRLISHSHVDAFDIIISEAVCNKSPIVRCRCLEYTLLALQSWDVAQLLSYKDSIGSLFSIVCCDSTKDVRSAGKRLFKEFTRLWPEDSRMLFQTLDTKLQKVILAEYPDLQDIVSLSDDDFIANPDALAQQVAASRPSLTEVKAALRRESLASAHQYDDIVFVEKSSSQISEAGNLTLFPQISSKDAPKTPERPPTSPSLSFKFDQSHPSANQDRDRILGPALSPIPVEFLEGFPVPAPLRASAPSSCCPVMPEPSPLVKHSSRRFTSRIFGTPINGKLDESAIDDESSSSSSSSSCPTIEQSFDEADEAGRLSLSSSVAAESIDVLSRNIAPADFMQFDEPTQSRESVLLFQSKLEYLRTMATSVFDECESPVRTIEIHHDLISSTLEPINQSTTISSTERPNSKSQSNVLLNSEHAAITPPKQELKCDSTLKVGNLLLEASKSPKDVLSAVLSSPSSEHVFRSPDSTPVPAFSKTSYAKRSDVDEDNSTLRSVLFILLSMIMFAILFHGLPDFLRSGSDHLISKSNLHYLPSQDDSTMQSSSEHYPKVEIPIRDSGDVIYESFDPEESMHELEEKFNDRDDQPFQDSSEHEPSHFEDLSNSVVEEHAVTPVTPSGDAVLSGLGHSSLIPDSKFVNKDAFNILDENLDMAIEPNVHKALLDIEIPDTLPANFTVQRSPDAISSDITDDNAVHTVLLDIEVSDTPPSKFANQPTPNFISSDLTGDNTINKDLLDIEIFNTLPTNFTDQSTPADSISSDPTGDNTEEHASLSMDDCLSAESEDSTGFNIPLTPKLAYLYTFFVAAICWLAYRVRMLPTPVRTVDRDPDFDLTGVTMAPEWDINLDSVLPSGPSPLPHPGGTDYQKWNHIKKDGTTMTLFSPLRRTLRIRRPRRPTQF